MARRRFPLAARSIAPRPVAPPGHGDPREARAPRDGRHEPAALRVPLAGLASILFVSGACALFYQVTWLRELRLVFGASTPATAAVLAIFMGGLGVGSAWLGPRADRTPRPLQLYARLEIAVGLTALATPVLFWLVRQAYGAIGGTTTLGPFVGTTVRIVLAVIVLGPACVLMGGTLPAAARAAETDQDRSRGRIGLLYGVNALGAVTGAALATFVLLELLGARATIWLAAGTNLILGFIALRWSMRIPAQPPHLRLEVSPRADAPRVAAGPSGSRPAPGFVLAAAGAVGAAFFLMEIVWYRMLTPLLGGSTYSFGIILAVALLGVGLGGAGYGVLMRERRPTSALLAMTGALEALFLAIPYALGDRLALLAVLLRPLGQIEFAGMVAGWSFLTAVVVLPAALVAGFQFPVLLGLLGEGGEDVGRHTGAACAWNTAGAILGSLAGGFGLLPLLSAPGLWRVVTMLLALLGVGALALRPRRGRFGLGGIAALPVAIAAILLVTLSAGPTAAWRHSSIGAGRTGAEKFKMKNPVTDWLHLQRRGTLMEMEGRESSIAANNDYGISLLVGGKSDGNVINDAGTQVMLGMLGALLHPHPRNAFVIGLGTGTSAGWLGRVPSIERVEVAEIEPAVARVAALCAPVNQDVLANPRVMIRIGDGREILLTTRERYDLIVSEPSNPYRAGVASLFTSEFYRAASRRLAEGGLFLQWTQIYEIDYGTLGTVFTTICGAFPHVETWCTLDGDLLFVASNQPIVGNTDALRARLRQEPFRSAVAAGWRATNLEGVLARYMGNESLSRFLAGSGRRQANTDDRTVLEYAFARQAGMPNVLSFDALRTLALERGEHLPAWSGSPMDAEQVMIQRTSMRMMENIRPPTPPPGHPLFPRAAAMDAYVDGDDPGVLRYWRAAGSPAPLDLTELAMLADALAEAGDVAAIPYLETLRPFRAAEADFILARLHLRRGDLPAATTALETALLEYRRDPWTWPALAYRALPLVAEVAERDRGESARRMFAALEMPFSAYCAELPRLEMRLQVARSIEHETPGECMRAAVGAFEPNVPWNYAFLVARATTYARLGDPRAEKARGDVRTYVLASPIQFPAAGGASSSP